MAIVEQLKRDHQELRRIADELALLLAACPPADLEAFAACRWSLARRVTQHLALEDKHVYRPLEGGVTPLADTARRLKRELGDLYAAFQRHITEWSGEAIARDWSAYRREANALIKALHARINREEAELYPQIADDRREAA